MTPPCTSSATQLRGHVYDPGEPEYDEACTLFNACIERARATSSRCSHPHQVERRARVRARCATCASRCAAAATPSPACRWSRTASSSTSAASARSPSTPSAASSRVGGGLTWAEVDAATQEHGLADRRRPRLEHRRRGPHARRRLRLARAQARARLRQRARRRARDRARRAGPRLGRRASGAVLGAARRRRQLRRRDRARVRAAPGRARGARPASCCTRAERARDLLRTFRDVMGDAPDELSLAYVFLTAPDEDGIPEALRGRPAVAIAGMHAGSLADAEAALAPLRAFGPPALDAFGPTPTPTSSPRSTTRPATATGGPPSTSTTSARTPSRRSSRSATTSRPGPRRSSSPPGAARSRACPRARPR